MRTAERPGGDLADRLLDPALWASDPHPLLAELRRRAPMAWNRTRGFWAVTRHADVLQVESYPATFCAGQGILVDEIGASFDSPPTILHCDPPVHTRYRRLVQPGFRPSVIRRLQEPVRRRAGELVAALPAGTPVDVLPALAIPLPIQVICSLIGMPADDWRQVHAWSEAVIPGATDLPAEERSRLQGDMVQALVEAAAERRRQPRRDVLSELAVAELGGDRLSHAELGMFLVQLLVAGNETTRNLLAAGLVAFAEHPGQWQRLRRHPELLDSAVEELLRFTSPVVSFLRTATRDTMVGDQPVAAGDPLLMLFSSANRDEAVLGADADRFDIGRSPNPHLAFGFGNHFCLGAALARLEARVVLGLLVERFAAVELAGPPEQAVQRSGSSVVAGVRRAELRFIP